MSVKSNVVNEGHLYEALRNIFPSVDIYKNVKKELNIKDPISGKYIEFDIWIPSHHLCFEFQDSHHFITTHYYPNPLSVVVSRDYYKKQQARERALTLISIPCWWPANEESLISTITFQRPDLLFNNHSVPVCFNPPHNFFDEVVIPGVGELMLASFPQSNFINSISENTWWIGEKYDGIRCCWNPIENSLYTRYGRELDLRQFKQSLPSLMLDTELWFGRAQYQSTFEIISNHSNCYWPSLRMIMFDEAISAGYEYEERYHHILQSSSLNHPFAVIAMRMLNSPRYVANKDIERENEMGIHGMGWQVEMITEDGGEGIILQQSHSLYLPGRSRDLVKIKASILEVEGVVAQILDNLAVVKLPDGLFIRANLNPTYEHKTEEESERDTEAKKEEIKITVRVGDIVTVPLPSHTSPHLSRLFVPTISRVRGDLSWRDVVLSFQREKRQLNDVSLVPGFTDTKSPSHSNYMYNKIENRRKFFESFAEENSFDPLQPDNWYKIPATQFLVSKGAYNILSYYNQSFSNALLSLFPNIGLDKLKFLSHKNIWDNEDNRRKFFENFAADNNFDPLIADNWYMQPISKILSLKSAYSVISYYNYSIPKALAQLFPNSDLDESKFSYDFFSKIENRRIFFEKYARDNNFDPLSPQHWYTQPISRILALKGAHKVLSYHEGKLSKALIDLFPNIVLKPNLFNYSKNFWDRKANRRKLLCKYAKENNFDSSVANNWYSQPIEKLMKIKDIGKILLYHKHKLSTALMDLFPEIKWNPVKFEKWYNTDKQVREKLNLTQRHKLFFESYAKQHGFDPSSADNWYSQALSRIIQLKGAHKIITIYGSIPQALMTLFPNISLESKKFRSRSYLSKHKIVRNSEM